jgi:hypothetical protein
MESAERVKKYNKKKRREEMRKQQKSESSKRPQVEITMDKLVYQPHEEPAFFDLHVEKRHIEHLSKKTLDKEGKL